MTIFDRHLSGRLPAYLEGELPPRQSRRAETHLARCARCRSELAQVRANVALLEHLGATQAPERLWHAIEDALRDGERRGAVRIGTWRFASAALLLLMAAGAYWNYDRRSKPGWDVLRLDGSPAVGSKRISASGRIGPGEWIETDGVSRARIRVGRIGSVDVEPNTRLRVAAAGAREHRLALESGAISARISAPPRLFFVDTPSGTAVDLGCEYELRCDRAGAGVLRVTAGWVSFEWRGRESLVPAGAACHTRPGQGPGTPYFDDAPPLLVRALSTFDFENGGAEALAVVLSESRVRDTLSLWHLLSRVGPGDRARVCDRMSELSPPPAGVSRRQVVALDAAALQRWREELAWTW